MPDSLPSPADSDAITRVVVEAVRRCVYLGEVPLPEA